MESFSYKKTILLLLIAFRPETTALEMRERLKIEETGNVTHYFIDFAGLDVVLAVGMPQSEDTSWVL
jgi:hypothetical protein